MSNILYKQVRSKLIYAAEKIGIAERLREKRNEGLTEEGLPDNEKADYADVIKLDCELPEGFLVGLAKDIRPHPYWNKFERFFKNNNIAYEFFDIRRHDFAKVSEKYDMIVWHPNSDPMSQAEAKSKIEYIEKHLGKVCLPCADSLWFYEDKIRESWLLQKYDLPLIPTFVSYSKSDAIEYVKKAPHPLIFKESTSSGSFGVYNSKSVGSSIKIVNKVFGAGRKSSCPYQKQKNYVYIQEMIPNPGFDLRTIVVGDSVLGYFRYPKKNDYRASGAGNVVKQELPKEAMDIARKVKNLLPYTPMLAVDFLLDERDNTYKIIEISVFIGCETCEQLAVDGEPGRYVAKDGGYTFEKGRFWIQELMLKDLMEKKWKRN